MNWVKRLLVLGGLTLFSLFPALGVQATPTLTSGYQDKVVFHTPSHMAKWNKSTLKGLNPHVLVAFIGLMLVIIPGTFLYRGRKNQLKAQEVEPNVDVVNAEIKKQIILAKISQLEQQFAQGKISELVQLKLNIETSVGESTPTEAEYGVPFPLVEVGVSRLDQEEYTKTLTSYKALLKKMEEERGRTIARRD